MYNLILYSHIIWTIALDIEKLAVNSPLYKLLDVDWKVECELIKD